MGCSAAGSGIAQSPCEIAEVSLEARIVRKVAEFPEGAWDRRLLVMTQPRHAVRLRGAPRSHAAAAPRRRRISPSGGADVTGRRRLTRRGPGTSTMTSGAG